MSRQAPVALVAEFLRDLLADVESESRAGLVVSALVAVINHGEHFVQFSHVLPLDPNTSILHRYTDVLFRVDDDLFSRNRDATMKSKLDCVAYEIEENLTKPSGLGTNLLILVEMTVELHFNVSELGLPAHDCDDATNHVVDLSVLICHVPAFIERNLRVEKHVVGQAQEVLGAVVAWLDVLVKQILGVPFLLHGVDCRDETVERSPEVMRDRAYHHILELFKFLIKALVVAVQNVALFSEDDSLHHVDLQEQLLLLEVDDFEFEIEPDTLTLVVLLPSIRDLLGLLDDELEKLLLASKTKFFVALKVGLLQTLELLSDSVRVELPSDAIKYLTRT